MEGGRGRPLGSGIRDSKLLNRASMKKELIKYADGFISSRADIPIVIEEKDKERVVHQTWDKEMPIII